MTEQPRTTPPEATDTTDAAAAPEMPEPAADAGVEDLAVLEGRLAEMEDRWRRAMAEVENQRKRIARDLEQRRGEERSRAAAPWLPVLDNLDLALQHADADPASIVEGVRAVRDQALAVLSGLGFPRREDEAGAPFDPARHEAVAAVPDTEREGRVLQVVRPGYGDGDHQLRPASVVVATRGT
ncbi:MAG TPA: nucleotide exchange factor GrpE [Mycobacteriales bacterium]|jgi:molecular chaperone GrpE